MLSFERRPKLLKDFLQDDPYSCSSNDFKSYPRKFCKSTSSHFHGSRITSKNASSQLHRSRSSRAATATISAINKVINIVKFLPFASVKSPSIFPTSISRKLSRSTNHRYGKKHDNVDRDVLVTVKVKDILRWKSFRDLVDEKSTPLDSSYSRTTIANSTTATTSTSRCSKSSSWCDSDFTAEEDLPSWWSENGDFLGEKNGMKNIGRKNILEEGVGRYNMQTTRATKRDTKEELCLDENEQHSPVSVLESPFHEDDEEEGTAFSFHRSLSNLDKKKSMLMQRIQQFESLVEGNTSFKEEKEEHLEEIEEKSKQMLSHLKETNNLFMEEYVANSVDELLYDFFWHELSTSRNLENNVDGVSHEKLMREAKSWINGEYNGEFEWEIEDKREAYIKDMERVVKWIKFEEEKQELSLDVEFQVFNDLIHEVLKDVLFSYV